MEKIKVWEQEAHLINELTQGYELTKQLKRHIDPMASLESCEFMIQKIISTYDKALSMLKLGDLLGELPQLAGIAGPPNSLTDGSPRSEPKDQCHKVGYKKRKTSPRWTEQVRVCSGTGAGSLDDGYSWRKYGQKDILGANFPRAYYRCTYRHVQGCLATKLVQKSDSDPSKFEITYRGRHTCIQTPTSNGKEFAKQKIDNCQPHLQEEHQSPLYNYGTNPELETVDMGKMDEIFPSFSFPSTPIESENVEPIFFPELLMEKNFLGTSDSLAFLSPETSNSSFLSSLQFPIDNLGFGENLQHSEYDLSEIISAPTSVANSPTGDLGFFSLDQVDFDPSFQFDTSEFFC